MASPRFDAAIVAVSRRMNDASNTRWSETLVAGFLNEAIRDIYKETYMKFGSDIYYQMPDICKLSGDTTVTAGTFVMAADQWIVLEIKPKTGALYYRRITHNLLKVIQGLDGIIQPSSSKPYFYQLGRSIFTLGVTSDTVHVLYVQQPADMTKAFATDIPLSPNFDGEIIQRATAKALAEMKSAVAV